MELAGKEFVEMVKYYSDVWWPAKKVVEDAVEDAEVVDMLCLEYEYRNVYSYYVR